MVVADRMGVRGNVGLRVSHSVLVVVEASSALTTCAKDLLSVGLSALPVFQVEAMASNGGEVNSGGWA